MRVSVVVMCLSLAAAAVHADAQSARKPWLVPLEERIAARTNVRLAQERVRLAAAAMAGRSLQQQSSGQARAVDELSGSTNPELFLPHEVFRKLIALAFIAPPRVSQVFREDRAKHLDQLPPDFWDQLRTVSTIYVADQLRDEAIGRSPSVRDRKSERAVVQRDLCRSRTAALAEARRTFGRERFDRFLYESIAPHMHMATDTLPSPEELMRLERGCP